MNEITREQWLHHAVVEIDAVVFGGDLDTLSHKFQISCGRCKSNKSSETIQPTDIDDLPFSEFFPTTISIDWRIKNPIDILATITYECIRAFLGYTSRKELYSALEKYYFDKPYNEVHPTSLLVEQLEKVLETLNRTVGEWPGKPVQYPKPHAKSKTNNKIVYVCPECGMELTTNKKKLKKGYENMTPTCLCGCKMSIVEESSDVSSDVSADVSADDTLENSSESSLNDFLNNSNKANTNEHSRGSDKVLVKETSKELIREYNKNLINGSEKITREYNKNLMNGSEKITRESNEKLLREPQTIPKPQS